MLQDEDFQAARQRIYSYKDIPQDMLAATQAAKVGWVLPAYSISNKCKQQTWQAWLECRGNRE